MTLSRQVRRISAAVLALIGCSGVPLRAQQPALDGPHRPFQDSLFDRLAGNWTLTGTIQGEPASQTLRAEWVLNHQFLKLEFRDAANPPDYQAHAYIGYDNASERYVAHWIDVFGGRWSETLGYGRREGTAVKFVFEYPDGPFHNTFTWDPGGQTWTMHLQNRGPGGAWHDFARLTLQRTR